LLTGGIASAADLPIKPSDLVKQSQASDWRPTDPQHTLYMDSGGRVVIELAPVAPQNIANIETLVKEKYFDGLAILRSQDNCGQWGDPQAESASPRPLGSAKTKVVGEFACR
jgi:peptidylprolyl isomerase